MSNIKCPNCNRGCMDQYNGQEFDTWEEITRIQCSCCGYWAVVKRGNTNKISSSNMFTLEFSTVSGESGKFCGTKQDIQIKIDDYEWLTFKEGADTKENKYRSIANCIEILKYGYQFEFKENDYAPYKITVDNSLWMEIKYGIW